MKPNDERRILRAHYGKGQLDFHSKEPVTSNAGETWWVMCQGKQNEKSSVKTKLLDELTPLFVLSTLLYMK